MESLDLEDNQGPGAYQQYLDVSSAPLTSFLFALPLFIVYHAGLWWLNNFSGLKWANAVDIAIADGLGKLGMAGPLLSFICVILVFLAMHAMSGKAWRNPPAYTWFLMILESLVMALPVFILSRLVVNLISYLPLSAWAGEALESSDISWKADLVLSCGAGVYEEFFFRVVIMGVFLIILDRGLGMQGGWKYVIAAVLQAALFSATHHLPGGPEAIATLEQARAALPVFSFRTVAGIYFAVLYIERGFGIAAGAHACYDLLVVMMDYMTPQEIV